MSEGETDSSPDVYVRQLREIFLACDSSGSGLLNRDDLQRLCRRLNLESDINKRITDSLCVAADDRRCVGFDQFKETFINILTESEQTADNGDQTLSGRPGSDGLENAIDLSEEEKHLLGIWKELGVGANGNLNVTELHQVCQFLNMGHMTNKDVEQLFAKLDVDGDGFVSFSELLHGLFEIGEISHPEESSSKPNALPVGHGQRMMSLPLQNSYTQRSLPAQSSHSLHAHEGILAFLRKEGSGFANSQTIVELWESLGIREGHLILKLLRFDVKKSISLLDLSLALVDEIHAIEVDNNIVYEAALSTVEHALDYLHSVNEDVKLERDRLVSDLSAMKKRNAAIVEEFDELCSSTETQKTNEQRLAAVEIETKYQQVLTQLKQETDDCNQLERNLNATKQEVASLVEKLRLTDKAKDALELELFHMSEKCCSLEKELEQKELEQKELEKKELDNRRQQKVKEMELSSAVVNDNYETQLETLMRGMSMERKDIEGAFRMEIDELEQRHLNQLSSLKKEFEKEKDDLVSGHKRHLAEAVAERERDLLTEFAKETAQDNVDSAEFKELQERLHLAQETAEERRRYAKDLETKLSALQDSWSPEEKSDKRRPDAVQQLDEEEDGDEEMQRRDGEHLMEKWREEKQKMLEKFQEDLATIHKEHKQDLAQLNNNLTQGFRLERDKVEASFVDERRKLEQKITSMENELQKKEEEKERYKKEVEKEVHKKDLESTLCKKELEEQLRLKDIEKERHITELERDLRKKEEEKQMFKNKLEEELHKKELEKELYRTELERGLSKKEDEQQLFRNELEEQLHKKELEKDLYRTELVKDLSKKEEVQERRKKELEEDLQRKENDNDILRCEIEKLKQLNEKIEFEKMLKEEPSQERKEEGYLKLQVDELCRNNVRLKDELNKRDGELLRLRQELERSRQLKRDHLTSGSGDHQLMTKTVAMADLKDVLMEKDLLKKQLQLTVKQLAEATSTLSLMSDELKKEKEMTIKFRGQMVERTKYDEVVMRLRDAQTKAHHLQHDCDFRAAETTKLLSLSQTVSKQRLSHLMEENEKLEKQMKQRKTLINDQLTKITKQAEELVKSDALIRDLYIENAHLIRCLQMTEGNRQDSDLKVQVLHQKCLDLGRLLSNVGPLAFNHH